MSLTRKGRRSRVANDDMGQKRRVCVRHESFDSRRKSGKRVPRTEGKQKGRSKPAGECRRQICSTGREPGERESEKKLISPRMRATERYGDRKLRYRI